MIEQIARWKLRGFSYSQIWAHMLEHKIFTKYGRPWSIMRIQRACVWRMGGAAGLKATTCGA